MKNQILNFQINHKKLKKLQTNLLLLSSYLFIIYLKTQIATKLLIFMIYNLIQIILQSSVITLFLEKNEQLELNFNS